MAPKALASRVTTLATSGLGEMINVFVMSEPELPFLNKLVDLDFGESMCLIGDFLQGIGLECCGDIIDMDIGDGHRKGGTQPFNCLV